MTTATAKSSIRLRVVNISAPWAGTGESFLEQAKADLHIWGGMSHSIERNDELEHQISFDPRSATGGGGGISAVFAWLDGLGIEWTAEFMAWGDETT